MTSGGFRFADFELDARDRRLRRDGAPVELNARYLDALALLVGEAGRLVTKERFHDEVWRGVPVTDEALTQCVRTLRRQLGDDAARPRFIETVPKHGYRFIAPVEAVETRGPEPAAPAADRRRPVLSLGAAGMLGGGVAGAIGGLIYGFAAALGPTVPGAGSLSMLLVILCVTVLIALLGAAGVSFAIAAAGPPGPRGVAAGAGGGLVVGALAKLIGLDAFSLLVGSGPSDITGAPEGALIGGAVGLGAWLASRTASVRRALALAGLAGGAGGLLVILFGGRLMAGSLDLLARTFPGSRLRLDAIAALFGESGLGPVSQAVTGALEGALFAAGVVGAMHLARRSLAREQ